MADPEPVEPAPILEDDPILGAAIANFPSDRLRLLRNAALIYAPVAVVLNVAFLPVDAAIASVFVIGGMALVAVILAWWVLHYWNREVVLFERGFSYREGSYEVYILYHEVESVRLQAERIAYFGGLLRRTVHRLTLHTQHDERILLDNTYKRIDALAARIEGEVNRVLAQRVRDRLAAGETVAFGPHIRLTAAGLHPGADESMIAWDAFAGWSAQKGHLYLRSRDGREIAVPLAELENPTLLAGLLSERGTGTSNQG